MASAIIHLAVAKELYQYFDIADKKDYYLGAIAPDIAKQIGRTKQESHFLYSEKENVPNIKMFTDKYPNFKNISFDLGYYIHLFTDKLWFDKFLGQLVSNNAIKLIDGTILNCKEEEIAKLIYMDYTNLNIQVIDEYKLDLSLFYEEFKVPKTKITEIPIQNLDILIDKMGIIIENSKTAKNYIFDIFLIKQFIKYATKRILTEIKDYEYTKA